MTKKDLSLEENKETNFSNFGKQFQEKLSWLISIDPAFANQIGEVIDINFFELKYLRVFVKMIYDFKSKYKTYPSKDTIETLIRTEIKDENEVSVKQIRDFYARFASVDKDSINDDYIKNNSIEFCKKQKLKEAMIKSVELLKNSSFEEIRLLVDNAIKLGSNPDVGYSYDEHFEKRYEINSRNQISTGWPALDKFIKGGLGEGELGIFVGGSGLGKSQMLCCVTAAALQQGKNVIYYTLELSDKEIGLRIDSRLTGIPLDALPFKKDLVREKITDNNLGKLIIKEYPTKSASVSTIRNHLEKIKQRGTKIDLIVIDYADLLKPSTSRKEKREELETLYEEIRGLAKENKIPAYTVSQTNRSGYGADVATVENISEAFNKVFVCDLVITISRTLNDKRTNSGRMLIAKSRLGPDGIILPMYIDLSCLDIKVFEPTNETKDDIEKASAKNQAQRLKEKYLQHKKDKENS